jgi:hypothetical protein
MMRRLLAVAGSLILLAVGSEIANAQASLYTYFRLTEEDAIIVARADELLKDHSQWNQFDDRSCADDESEKKWSLFCALETATILVTGVADNRRAAIQVVRLVIEENTPGRRFKHPLKDFNNSSQTGFLDIKEVLSLAQKRIRAELAVGG